jgi:hypothetical protein
MMPLVVIEIKGRNIDPKSFQGFGDQNTTIFMCPSNTGTEHWIELKGQSNYATCTLDKHTGCSTT